MGLGEQTAQQLDFNSAHETCISFISITYCTRNSSIVYDFSNICVGYANKGRGKKKSYQDTKERVNGILQVSNYLS